MNAKVVRGQRSVGRRATLDDELEQGGGRDDCDDGDGTKQAQKTVAEKRERKMRPLFWRSVHDAT